MTLTQGRTGWSNTYVYCLAIILFSRLSDALAIAYCSPDNTANGDGSSYQYMSNGWCQTHCQAVAAYAVIQDSTCWCSNAIPPVDSQTDTLSCNEPCPGYGIEWCGSKQAGLYGYFALSSPSGTAGDGSSSPSVSTALGTLQSSPSPTSTPSSSLTVVRPQTSVSSSSSSVAPSSSSSSDHHVTSIAPASTGQSSATSASSASTLVTSPSPSSRTDPTQVYTSITTVTGQVRTVVVTPSATADATLGQGATSNGGVSTAKVVGIVLGVVVGLAALIGLGVFFWLRRKRLQDGSVDGSSYNRDSPRDPARGGPLPSRQVSQMSSSGLLAKNPRIFTNGTLAFANLKSPDSNGSGHDRRSLGTDQRLNPLALYVHDESHLSSVSLQDNQDYSRQLRVANPDM